MGARLEVAGMGAPARAAVEAIMVCGAAAAVVLTLEPSVTEAQETGGSMHASPHTDESEVLVGGKAMGMLEHVDQDEDVDRAALGAGLYVETSLVPGWVELEIGAVALRMPDETELLLEPLLKKNLHLDDRVDLYVGIGPTVGVALHDDGDATWMAGGFLVLGAYLWLDRVVGMDVDVTVELAAIPEPVVAVVVGLGPAFRL